MGGHHHVTLSLLALRFLVLERLRVGGKTPAATVSQVREIFTRLLQSPAASPARISEVVVRELWRKEAALIYKWWRATGAFPPRRPPPYTI